MEFNTKHALFVGLGAYVAFVALDWAIDLLAWGMELFDFVNATGVVILNTISTIGYIGISVAAALFFFRKEQPTFLNGILFIAVYAVTLILIRFVENVWSGSVNNITWSYNDTVFTIVVTSITVAAHITFALSRNRNR